MNWLEKILIEALIKMIEVSFKGAFKIVTKIALFIMFCMYKLIKHYLRYAVPGVLKMLWYPKFAPFGLISILLCIVDAKFFYNTYTFNNYKYSEYVHLIILLLPFTYIYGLGKTNIVVEEDENGKEKVVYREPEKVYIKQKLPPPINVYINQPRPDIKDTQGWEMKEAKKIDVIDIKTIEHIGKDDTDATANK